MYIVKTPICFLPLHIYFAPCYKFFVSLHPCSDNKPIFPRQTSIYSTSQHKWTIFLPIYPDSPYKCYIKLFMYPVRAHNEKDRTFIYSNRTLIYSNGTPICFDKTHVCSDKTYIHHFLKKTSAYPSKKQPQNYITAVFS